MLSQPARFAREFYHDIALKPDVVVIVARAHAEVQGRTRPLGVDRQRYQQMSRAGMHWLFTARVDGELIGFLTYIVTTSLHYGPGWLEARHDAIYVEPAHRKGSIPLGLMGYAEASLKRAGVYVIYHGDRVAMMRGHALQRMGYKPIEIVYEKLLTDIEKEMGEAAARVDSSTPP